MTRCLTALCLLLVPQLLLAQTTIIVLPNSSIQAAMMMAQNGDTVLVKSGTYNEYLNFFGKAITVRSDSGASKTVINAGQDSCVVIFGSGEGATSVLQGFTLTGGKSRSPTFGGGITCLNASPTIRDNVITGNQSLNGGGIHCRGRCSPRIENNIFTFNISTSQGTGGGGAIRIQNDSLITPSFQPAKPVITGNTITNNAAAYNAGGLDFSGDLVEGIISHCTVSNNTALFGGGIHLDTYAHPLFENLTVSNNTTTQNGAGIGVGSDCYPTVRGAVIFGNRCPGKGGGIQCFSSRPVIERCLIYDNHAGLGGGIYNWTDSRAKILNCTITENEADEGGGIGIDASARPAILNTIIWNNAAPQSPHIGGVPDTVAYCTVEGGFAGAFNLALNPLFTNAPLRDYTLTSNSPCIDAGAWLFVLRGDTVLRVMPEQFAGVAPDIGYRESAMLSAELPQAKPETFLLNQNYPNPFNPETVINYELGTPSAVKLKVFDMLGREIQTLVNERKPIGKHSVRFNGTGLSSGVYFYRLQTSSFSRTRKMVLVK